MTRLAHGFADSTASEAGNRFARLRHVLALAEQIAGRAAHSAGGIDDALDESARIGGAYDAAPPLVRRHFDAMTEEVAAWASAGLDALAAVKDNGRRPRAAAARLADMLERGLGDLRRLLRA